MIGCALLVFYRGWRPGFLLVDQVGGVITAPVTRSSFPVVVTAGGELASAEAVKVVCELEGESHKIIEMLPEGTRVSAGMNVIRLDPADINDRLAAQQIKVTLAEAAVRAAEEDLKIQKNLAASQIAQANLALQLATLDQEKYVNGEYQVQLNELQGSIALAMSALQDAQAEEEYFRDLVKKGFCTPEQLRAKEQAVKQAEFNVNRDQERLKVLETYTHKRQVTELDAKAEEASREMERAKSSAEAATAKATSDFQVATATAALERKQLERIQGQLEMCSVRAPVDGTVVYSKERNKSISLGSVVHFKQDLFSLPSSNRMKVDAYVHESAVKKVLADMRVEVRIDAFPNVVLRGSVDDVASFYDSTRHWLSGGVKEYATTISLQETSELALRTGMTAEVRIFVAEVSNGLVVPLPAVSERDGAHYCFVVAASGVEPRRVELGLNTDDYVEIRSGLEEGERVALDARLRLDSGAASQLQPSSEQNDVSGATVAANK